MVISVGQHWFFEIGILLLGHPQKVFPLLFILLFFLLDLFGVLQSNIKLVLIFFLKRFLEHYRVDFFKNGLKCIQGLLKNFVPMSFSKVADDWNKKWEGVGFVGFEDVKEVVIFKETHRPISNLQVKT